MEEKDEIIKGLLAYKAKIMADKNDESAIIEEELKELKEDVSRRISSLSDKIKKVVGSI